MLFRSHSFCLGRRVGGEVNELTERMKEEEERERGRLKVFAVCSGP